MVPRGFESHPLRLTAWILTLGLALLPLRSPVEGIDEDGRAREDLGLVAVVPANAEGRPAVLAEHLEDFGVSRGLALMMGANDEAIARLCVEW